MSEERKDNSGAAFSRDKPACTGDCRFNGVDYYLAIFQSGAKSESAPSHNMVLWPKERDSTDAPVVIALFRSKEGSKSLLDGKHAGHWVNVFANESTNGVPYLGVKFRPMEDTPSQPAAKPQASASSLV